MTYPHQPVKKKMFYLFSYLEQSVHINRNIEQLNLTFTMGFNFFKEFMVFLMVRLHDSIPPVEIQSVVAAEKSVMHIFPLIFFQDVNNVA
jgi:hypothetical protein